MARSSSATGAAATGTQGPRSIRTATINASQKERKLEKGSRCQWSRRWPGPDPLGTARAGPSCGRCRHPAASPPALRIGRKDTHNASWSANKSNQTQAGNRRRALTAGDGRGRNVGLRNDHARANHHADHKVVRGLPKHTSHEIYLNAGRVAVKDSGDSPRLAARSGWRCASA